MLELMGFWKGLHDQVKSGAESWDLEKVLVSRRAMMEVIEARRIF